MKFLSRLVRGRSPRLGLLSDVAMVGAAAFRVARRPADAPASRTGPIQWVLVAGAAMRILARIRQVRRNRRAGPTGS